MEVGHPPRRHHSSVCMVIRSIGKCGYLFSLSVKFGPVQLKIWFQWFDSLASLCIIVPSQSLGVTVDAYIYCCIVVDTVVSSLMCAAQR